MFPVTQRTRSFPCGEAFRWWQHGKENSSVRRIFQCCMCLYLSVSQTTVGIISRGCVTLFSSGADRHTDLIPENNESHHQKDTWTFYHLCFTFFFFSTTAVDPWKWQEVPTCLTCLYSAVMDKVGRTVFCLWSQFRPRVRVLRHVATVEKTQRRTLRIAARRQYCLNHWFCFFNIMAERSFLVASV